MRNLINRINQSRSSSGTEQFYNLPVVQICARAISRLSVDQRISDIKDLWSIGNQAMIEIITAFYRGSGGSTQSFMGKSVINNAIFALSNFCNAQSQSSELEIENLHQPEIGLGWISSILRFRTVKSRSCALSILVTLTGSVSGSKAVCQTFGNKIWRNLILIALDDEESAICRSLAFSVLTRLLRILPQVSNTNPLEGVTFLALISELQKVSFYPALAEMLQNYHHCDIPTNKQKAPVTPKLLTSITDWLTTLLSVAEQDTKVGLATTGIPRILVQLSNVRLISLSDCSVRRSLMSQVASTVQLLNFAHNSPEEILPLAISLFSLSLELHSQAQYEVRNFAHLQSSIFFRTSS